MQRVARQVLFSNSSLVVPRALTDATLPSPTVPAGLLDAVPLFLASFDRDGRHLCVNSRYAEQFAVTPDVLIGRPIVEVFGQRAAIELEPFIARVLSGAAVTCDLPLECPPADARTLRLMLTPMRDSSGDVTGWHCAAEDVTAARAAQARSRNFGFVLQRTNDFVGISDLEFRPVFVNDAGAALVGLEPGQTAGANVSVFDFIMPEHHPWLRDEFFPRVLREGHAAAEIKFRHFVTGRPIWMEYSVIRMDDDGGRPSGYATISRNLTEAKAAEAMLLDAIEGLRGADRQKDEFIGVLSHELRNPLAPMVFALSLLDQRERPDNERRALDVLARQVERMRALVDELLDVSRVRLGKIELQRERVDLRTIVQHAIEAIRPSIEARRHRMSVDLPDEPAWVIGDSRRMGQVVDNVLANAAKYTPDAGAISVAIQSDRGEIALRVRDTGIGIEPSRLSRVFDLFEQDPGSRPRSDGGLGIGLALVERLVRLHGGRVVALSEGTGRGAEFVVTLPAA